MTNIVQSIDPNTNNLNEVFKPSSSNNVDTQLSSVSDYNSLALDSENDLIMMLFNICSYDAHNGDMQTIFDNGSNYPRILALSETLFSEENISDSISFQEIVL